jgi:hypothetical protein
MLLIEVAPFALLAGISYWVWQDAARRNMSPLWAIAVGLMLIVFLPLYLAIRKPVKCGGCGKKIPASLSSCSDCEQRTADEQGEGRVGRIFG